MNVQDNQLKNKIALSYNSKINRDKNYAKLNSATAESKKLQLGLPVDRYERSQIPFGTSTFIFSGFDYSGIASSESDGLKNLADDIAGSIHLSWNDKKIFHNQIKRIPEDIPLILIGHSFGGDTAVELANELSETQSPRTIDLLVTIDSVGFNNNIIPGNVRKNLNFFSNQDFFINGSPNAPRIFDKTQVENRLWPEKHTKIDDSSHIHSLIKKNIFDIYQI